MAKMFHKYDAGAMAKAMERIRDGADHGSQVQRPQFDPRERAELLRRASDGKSPEAMRRVLEHHGFRFYPAELVAEAALMAGTEMVTAPGEAAPEVEGQWRHTGLRLALTPSDLVANYASHEDLDRWVKREKLERRLTRARVGKAERRLVVARS